MKYKDSMTRDQVIDLLNYLGATKINDRGFGDNIQFTCTVHKESTPSAGISVDKGVYHCFACHSSGSIPWLVHESDPDTFKSLRSAEKFLRDRYGVDFNQTSFDFTRNIRRYGEDSDTNTQGTLDIDTDDLRFTLPKVTLAPFRSGIETYNYFFNRGFTKETLETFKIGRDLSNKCVTIPIFWEDDELCGVIGRFIDPNRPHNFRYLLYEEFPKSSILFPLNKLNLEPTEPLILVEGVLDALWLHQLGFKNSLSQLGNEISEAQLEILSYLCKDRDIILFYDNDKGGSQAIKRFRTLSRTKGYNFRIKEVNYSLVSSEYKDAQDMSKEQILLLVSNPIGRKLISKYS